MTPATNYLKVRRAGSSESTEIFFDGHDQHSINTALAVVRLFSPTDPLATEGAGLIVSVFRHGAPHTGQFPCVGGCELCAPATVEDPEEIEEAAEVPA